MEKLNYTRTEMKVIELDAPDVIATSLEFIPSPPDPYEFGGN